MATIRENVLVVYSDFIMLAEYIKGSPIASKGQPFEELPRINVKDGTLSVLFMSGRKKSPEVARDFINAIGGKNRAFATQGGSGGLPKELNFMFGLRINTKYGEVDVYFGQGSNATRNNWWLGSSHLSVDGDVVTLDVGGNQMNVTVVDMLTEVGDFVDVVTDVLPSKLKHIKGFFGDELFKHFFGAVNTFKID